jgi:IPT/TIG domain
MKSRRAGWIRILVQAWFSQTRQLGQKARTFYRLHVERLEDRVVPTTYTVTNILASGAGSLAAAVQSANANTTSASLINFSPTVFANPQTITLTNNLTFSNPSQPVTIQGPSNVAVTVSGNRQGGAQIQDFVVSAGTVTIQNLIITDGNASSNNGGGIDIAGGTVTIDHCTVSNCTAAAGGGIEVTGTTIALFENCTINGNTAAGYGGGIDINGDSAFMTLIGCTISNNALLSGGQKGGGINVGGGSSYISQGLADIIDCTITGNTANGAFYGGGGIGTSGGNLLVESSTITGNSASSSSGGGFRCDYYYAMTLENDVIWNNTATTSPDLGDGGYDTPTVNYTLVGNTSGAVIPAGSVGNILNIATTPAILGAPGNNGGSTQSFLPIAGSPEIGSGGNITTANAAVSSSTAATLSVANGYLFAASSLTPQVSFVTQPTNTTAGAPMAPVTVQISRPVDFEEYIRVDNEIMEIVGLTINGDGTASLNVERGVDGTTATTHAANAPIYLISDQRGMVVNQPTPHVDIGAVQSAGTIPSAGLGLALAMWISTGNLNGTTTALTNSTGQAVFNNLSVPTAGTYQLKLAGIANSNSFTVAAGTYPIVTSVSPGLGSPGGTITITGTNFTGASAVSFGGTPAASFTVNSNASITATVPAGTGIVDVTVTNAVGTSGVSASDRFSYAPGVSSVSPNAGNASGGTVVTITGSNFVGVTGIRFGSNPAASFTVNSPTSISATAPAGGNVVDVTVVSAGGTSAIVAADHFSYSGGTAGWIVTNTLSSGPGSLFAAVQNANATTLTPSLITFDPTVFATPQTITLTGSLNLSNPSQPVTIQGPSSAQVTVSGNRQGGAQVQDFVVSTGTATIQNLTIADANAGSNDGGGFRIIAGNVTINHCTISNNIAADGGGMFLSGGNVLLENSVITANTTNTLGYGNGGGIATGGGTLTILGCLFTQNVSYGSLGGNGGAINEQNAIMTVVNSTFVGNMAATGPQQYGGTGGAIDSSTSPQTIGTNFIIGCTFTGNTAQNGGGGGIATGYYANLTLLNDLLWINSALNAPDLGDGSYTAPSVNYTLIGNPSASLIPAGSVGNILNVPSSPAILGPLANNGGPTQTTAEQAASPSIGAGGAVTTVSAAVLNSTTTSITVTNGSLFAASSLPTLSSGSYFTIQIGSEQLAVIGVNGSTLNVLRGVNGTTAATHASGAFLYLVSDQRGSLVPARIPTVVDMGAFQTIVPTVTGLSPNTGPAAGGSSVTITGANFTGVTAVMFGATSATSFTVNSATQITATDPAGTGVIDVTVTAVGGTSAAVAADHFTYVALPTVTSISPALGPAAGGTTINITGTNFTGATAVFFDGTPASIFTVTSATQIIATSPAGTGVVDITVVTAGGTSATSNADQFTYVPAPTVASVVVNGGNAAYTDSNGLSVSLAGQNSVVEQILVTFNESVDLDPGAFTITNNAAGVTVVSGPAPNTLPVTANFAPAGADKTQYIVTFSGPGTTAIPGGIGNVIDDGLYILNTIGSHVHANGLTAADNNTGFWALFGSAGSANVLTSGSIGDGNSQVFVNNPDFTVFKTTFGSETDLPGSPYQPYYNVSMDANLDGILDAIDYAKFKHNFGADWIF